MNRDKAYEIALQMFQLEAERWAKNALGLVVAIAAIFAGYGQIKEQLSVAWPFFLSATVSLAAVLIALSIRGTTDAWRETIKEIEYSAQGAFLLPYQMFENNLRKDSPLKNFPPWKDFKEIIWPFRKTWIRRVLSSVTRTYTLLFLVAFILFLVAGILSPSAKHCRNSELSTVSFSHSLKGIDRCSTSRANRKVPVVGKIITKDNSFRFA